MINKKWDEILKEEFTKEYYAKLGRFIKDEYKVKTIYPDYDKVFNALNTTDYDDVKVVILGQDPYHGENEAHGLSFSVCEGVKRPPSLNNIFKELESDLGYKREQNDLTDWATQGVFLLNSILTVIKDTAASHQNKGWEIFTDTIIKKLNEREKPIVFILWGNYARSKKVYITNKQHLILESVHPSPLSAHNGFFGSKPFSQANNFLENTGQEKINW